MTTYYVDNVNGNDANAGTSEALAKQTLSAACALLSAAGDILYVQATGTAYTLTSTITLTQDGSAAGGRIIIEGYTTTPGARDGRPLITTATNSTVLFSCNAASYLDFVHLSLSNTASTRAVGFAAITATSTKLRWSDCLFDGFSQAIAGSGAAFTSSDVNRCEIKNGTATTASQLSLGSTLQLFGCYVHDNAGDAVSFLYSNTIVIIDNVFDTNGRYGVYDYTGTGFSSHCIIARNTFYGMGSDAMRITLDGTSALFHIANNIFYNNGGYGQNWPNLSTTEDSAAAILNGWNAYGSNTSGARNGISAGTGDVTLTGDPFANAASGDFSLNNTSGAGAACRAAGFPGAFPGGTTTGYADIGAVQHQDAGGGGGLAACPMGGYVL